MGNRFGAAIRRSAMACIVAALGSAGSASATLLDRGPYLVYDDILEITWTRNANASGRSGLNWADAHSWAANLVYAGYDDWRLPYASVSTGAGGLTTQAVPCEIFSEVGCLDNEMGYMFYYNLGGRLLDHKTGNQTALGGQQLTGIQPTPYWSDSEFPPFGAWFFSFDHGGQNVGDVKIAWSAWAVRQGDSAYVPEPCTSSLLLIGVGMLGVVWARRVTRGH
jgi:PEP-CTERM motif